MPIEEIKALKADIIIGIVVIALITLSTGIAIAGPWTPSGEVIVTISINEKFELTVEEGGNIAQTLEPGETIELNGSTKINVKTNVKHWKITARVESDAKGFLDKTGAALAIRSDKNNVWTPIGTSAAVDVTGDIVGWGAKNPVVFKYQVTTSWEHRPGEEYPMVITYTAIGS